MGQLFSSKFSQFVRLFFFNFFLQPFSFHPMVMTWNLELGTIIYWQDRPRCGSAFSNCFQFFTNFSLALFQLVNLFHRRGQPFPIFYSPFPTPYQLFTSILLAPPGDDLELILAGSSKMWVSSQRSVTSKLQFEIKMTFLHLAGILMENMSTHHIVAWQ